MKQIFRSLRHYNFRLFFFGQIISLIGTWMQQLALIWLAYRLTHSGIWLGVVGFCSQAPVFVFGPLAGALIDRTNRHKLLILTQILAMLQAFVLAYLTIKGMINVYYLLILGTILGAINAFDMPVRQAFVTDIVDRDKMHNAIALNSTTINFSRMMGPALAGILVAAAGEGICFLLNGLSFLAALISLMLMKNLRTRPVNTARKQVIKDIIDGFRHIWTQPILKTLLLSITVVNFAIMAQVVIMPIFTEKTLHGGSRLLGFLMGASGLGSLLGSFYLAGRKNSAGLLRLFSRAALVMSICFLFFPLAGTLVTASGLMFIGGICSLLILAGSNTIFMLVIEDEYRGRMMSLYTMFFIGLAPLGSLIGGILVATAGIAGTYLALSTSLALIGFWVMNQSQKNIIPAGI